MQSIGLAAICGAPSGDLEAPKNFFKRFFEIKTIFLVRGVPPPGLFEWPPDVHKRSQDTTPTIFGCKRAMLQKCLFSAGKQMVFEGRVAKNIPLFRSEAATASHLDGNKLTRSLGNAPSALNEQKKRSVFWDRV